MRKILCFVVVAASFLILEAPLAHADPLPQYQCDNTQGGGGSQNCNYSNNIYFGVLSLSQSSTGFQGVRVDAGQAASPVDVYNECRYITNNNGPSIFVPFNNSAEWNDFIAATKTTPLNAYLTLNTCGIPWVPTTGTGGIMPPDTNTGDDYYCGSPTLLTAPSSLPYAPTGTVVPSISPYDVGESAQYQCTCQNSVQWTETITESFKALDADNNTPSWQGLGDILYSGTVPPGCNTAPQICGKPSFSICCTWQKYPIVNCLMNLACVTEVEGDAKCSQGSESGFSGWLHNNVDTIDGSWTCTYQGQPQICERTIITSYN